MLTNTDFNVPEYCEKHAQALFWWSGLLSVLCFSAGIYFESHLYFLIPFSVLLTALLLLNFRMVFFLLLFVLPLSVESFIGGFGTDLPSEPIVVLLAACTVMYLLVYKEELNRPSFRHPVLLLVFLQFVWLCIVTLFSTDIILSVKFLLAKSWYLLGFFILPVLLLRTEKAIRIFFWCLFIPTLGSVIFIVAKHGLLEFKFDNIQRAVHPIYRNHVNYAVFISMLLPFIFLAKSWYPAHYVRHKVLKYAVVLFLVAIFLSYTRGAWLAVVVMFAYLFVLHFRLTKQLLLAAGIAAVLFTGYILKDNRYLNYSPDFEHTIYHDELGEHLTSTFEMEDMSTVERFYRWIAAVKLIKDHPLVGVGPNNFVSNYKQYTVTAYETYISDNEERSTVHNYFLLLLTEQGIPALILFIALIAVVLITAENCYHRIGGEQKKYVAAITLCIVAFLLNNTLSDLVEANKVGSLFLMCLGLLVNFSSGAVDFKGKADSGA